ncbi:MarR family winged helix-turn-helix transcriptional regulator [Allorhizobium undicola]|uniref:MarR family winged helix-turn-helix transcriptional regulator n=1 Tax=Allorhizobium undicola TaxID=78527 RepID=UPI003D340697
MTQDEPSHRSFTTRLFAAARLWRRCIDAALSEHAISEATAAPLLWIGRMGGGVRQIALAEQIGIEGASLVRLLDQLEGMGYILRKDDPTDRRAKGLWLTSTGEEMAGKLEALLDEERSRLLHDIPLADLETALRVITVFNDRCAAARSARTRGEA